MAPDLSLPTVGIIAQLDDAARSILAAYGTFHTAPLGKVLIHQGKPHGRLFCVIGGKFEARRHRDGSDVVLGSIEPGDWIGEVDIFDPGSAMCSVVAAEPSRYWEITREKLEEFLNKNQTMGIILMIGLASTLGRRIRGITQKLADQSEKTAPSSIPKTEEFDNASIRSAADLAEAFLRQKDLARGK